MIRHDDKRSKPVLAQVFAAKQRFDYQHGDRFVPQSAGPGVSPVEITIHPDESFTRGNLAGRRKMRSWASCRADAT